jgi:hypothetical protein
VTRPWLVVGLVLSLGVNIGLVGSMLLRGRTEGRMARDFEPGGDPGVRLADRLALEGDVRERFLARQRRLAGEVRELRPRIGRLERELRHELVAREPDRARVEAVGRELAELTSAIDRAFVENVFDTREILDGRAEREFLRFIERFPGLRRAMSREPRDFEPRRPFPGPGDRFRDRPGGRPPGPHDPPPEPREEGDPPPP